MRHASVKTVGLCNIPIDMRMELAKHMNLDVDTVAIDYTGLNHLGWVRRVRIDGDDISDSVWEAMEALNGPANIH